MLLGTGADPSELAIDVPLNVNAADTTNADQIKQGGSLGLDLEGNGYVVGVWEAGGVIRDTHDEFTGRVTLVDTGSSTDHATHVAGTIAAAGVNADAEGMATQVTLRSYTAANDYAEMDADADLVHVSNHSYGWALGWEVYNAFEWGISTPTGQIDAWLEDRYVHAEEDTEFGKYEIGAAGLDTVLSDNPRLLSVWSSGNDVTDSFGNAASDNTYVTYLSGDPGDVGWSGAGYYLVTNSGATSAPPADGNGGTGFDTILPDQNAKNALIVGAVDDVTVDPYDSADVAITYFSSRGPTDDGRIKPDVVGNGNSLYSAGALFDSNYWYASGTSMSSPNVAGTAVLVIEHFEDEFSFAPRSATTKGTLIHTAFDAGNTGPDYTYGWGLVDGAAAAQFLTRAAVGETDLLSEQTYTGAAWTMDVDSDGAQPIKATIAWTDLPGADQGDGLDTATPVLVNDLDLWITGPGGTYYPWTLDVNNPSDPAVRNTANHVDNVEQVLIDSPAAGTYTIHVAHSGSGFNQDYSLLVSGAAGDDQTPPTVASVDPTSGSTISPSDVDIDVTFSESVVGVDSTDLVLSGTAAGSATVGTPVDMGSNTWRFPVSNLVIGNLQLNLAPDADDIEDAAGNDLAETTWSYTVAPDIDLLGTSFAVDPNDLLGVGLVSVTMEVANQGADAAGAFDIQFYLSDDADIDPASDTVLELDASDPNYDSGEPEAYHVGGLATGATHSGSVSLAVPGSDPFGTDNDYYIGMVVDADGDVTETNETNNRNLGQAVDQDGVFYGSTGPFYETDFNDGLPAGWTVIDGGSDGRTWTDTNPMNRSNENWSGTFMIADSEWARLRNMDESLITPTFDFSEYTGVTLQFTHAFDTFRTPFWGGDEIGDVDVRVGGGSWQNVVRYQGADASGLVELDLSSIADGQSEVEIRWHYYDAFWDLYWGIDNVQITANSTGYPTVLAVSRSGTDPTNAAEVDFTVTFSEDVTGVGTDDFSVVTTGSISGTQITDVIPASGPSASYTVTVSTGSGDGTIRLDVVDDDSIVDSGGSPLGGAGTGNGDYTGGEVYTIDKTAPVADTIVPSPGSAISPGNIDVDVTFSEAVHGVDSTDLELSGAAAAGATVGTPVDMGNDTWRFPVTTLVEGVLQLSLAPDADDIEDAVGNDLAETTWSYTGTPDSIGMYKEELFYLDTTGNGTWDRVSGGDTFHDFGINPIRAVAQPVTGDWDGDGDDDLGVYNEGRFYLDTTENGVWDKVSGGDTYRDFGIDPIRSTAIPVVGDWDGDGDDDLGLYNEGEFYLDTTENGIWDEVAGGDTYRDFGIDPIRSTAAPVIGDWDGDGDDDLGLYNQELFYLDTTENGVWDTVGGGDTFRDFGIPPIRVTAQPVIGDWDGDSIDDLGIHNEGFFYLDTNGNGVWDKVSGGDTYRDFGITPIRSTGLPLAGRWVAPSPLLAAGGVQVPDRTVIDLTDEQLAPINDQAIASWAESGLGQGGIHRLKSVDVRIADLPGARLGEAQGTTITLDIDAAGYGWFVDATPAANEEFGDSGGQGLVADPSGPAADRMDLLTVVLHELGHVLGHGDLDDVLSDDVMKGWLPVGVRRL